MSLPKPYYQDNAVTLYHGECMDMLGSIADCDAIITDPPYEETSLEWDQWPAGWPSLISRSSTQLWCFGSFRMFMEKAPEFAEWKLAQDIIWEKQNGSGLRNDRFRRVHELAAHFYQGKWEDLYHDTPRVPAPPGSFKKPLKRSTKPQHFGGLSAGNYSYGEDRLQRSVIKANNCHRYANHPTQKPVSIVAPLISYSVPPGGLVLDPFAGSGTTGRVAKDTGRRAILIEKKESNCEIIACRMSQEVLALS